MSGTKGNRSLHAEREALLRSNDLFPPDAQNRPARIYGYGNQDSGRQQYIVEEFINGGEFILLEDYQKQKGQALDQSEIAEIALGIADAIRTLNNHGIVFEDLQESNIFWDPQNRRVRLIDLERAQVGQLGDRISYSSDRERLANIIFSLATNIGNGSFTRDTIEATITNNPQQFGPLRQIIERAHLIGPENYGSAFSAEGTERMYEDLKQALSEAKPK